MSRIHPSVSWHKPSPSNSSKTDPNKTYPHDKTFSKVASSPTEYQFVHDADQAVDDASTQFNLAIGQSGLRWPQTFFVPIHYEANYAYPLVVWLHSDGFNENQVDQVMPHVSNRNYLATGVRATRAVDSVGHRFEWHESAAAMDAAYEKVLCAIDEVKDRYSVHNDRIVVAGYQAGGTMALRIALRDPATFSAAISLGGRMPRGGGVLGNLSAIRDSNLKMLWQCAMDCPSYDEGDLRDDIRQAMFVKAQVDIRKYPVDDVMNTAALADLNQWIMSRVVCNEPMSNNERWESSPACFSAN